MTRFKFSSLVFTVLFLAASGIAHGKTDAMLEIAGKYERISPAQPTQSADKVEVLELFWYGCPHCYSFEPYLNDWKAHLPAHAEFIRMPAIFREAWMPHAKAFYAAEEMGMLGDVHVALFNAMHKQKRKLTTREQIADLVGSIGLDRDVFLTHFDSFGVGSKVRRAALMTRRYGIKGVPSVIINGKYRVSASMAGSFPNMVKVINTLVDEEHNASANVASTGHGNP